VTPVLIGLLLAIGLALAVVGVVAYPHLREGASLLTPEGERRVREARQRAQALAGSAAEALINRDKDADRDPTVAGAAGSRPPAPGSRPPALAPGSRPVAPGVSGVPTGGGPGAVQSAPQPASHPAPHPASHPAPHPASSADPGLSALGRTTVVWASPPPQLRPDAATPAPGTSQVRGRPGAPGGSASPR